MTKHRVLESTWTRSLVKGLTWETSGLVTVAVISFVLTGDVMRAVKAGIVYFGLRVAMYFVHERIWKKFRWGHREVVQ